MIEKVFVYGTLRGGGKEAFVKGEMRSCVAFPTIKLGGETLIKGEIVEIDIDTLLEWDKYEGYNTENEKESLYVRRRTRTTEDVEVWIYEGETSWRLSTKMETKANTYKW